MSGLTPAGTRPPLGDELDIEGPFTEAAFLAGKNLEEGISGRKRLDSTYENYQYGRAVLASEPAEKTY